MGSSAVRTGATIGRAEAKWGQGERIGGRNVKVAKEVIHSVYALGKWHEVIRGTFRENEGGPAALGQDIYTWLEYLPTFEEGTDKIRCYVRSEEILGIKTITPENVD
jgi:hypothetical protein